MTSTLALDAAPQSVSRAALAPFRSRSTEGLGEAIAELAARLHAATYELLVLLREFDERAGWNCGFLSCAHWLHWRTGIDLGAAREKVRVAKALASLPRVSAAMQRGAISYAKVRAVTRVATPDNEGVLLDFAMAGTAAHVERFVRAWRRVDRVEDARQTEARHLRRELSTWVDDDRHGRNSGTADARRGRNRAARARSGSRSAVPRIGRCTERCRHDGGADARPATRRRAGADR